MSSRVGEITSALLEQEGISKDAAKALMIVQKAAAIAQIGISTAVAVMGALAAYPGPAGPIVAAGMIITGATQAALVAATPESFHTGGMRRAPDELLIRGNEVGGVLTQQGIASMGGERAVNAANRGEQPGGEIVVVQQYQHRAFDAFVADNVRMSGPLRNAIRGKRRIGHARRR